MSATEFIANIPAVITRAIVLKEKAEGGDKDD